MKISIILSIALLFNTSLLLAKPFTIIMEHTNQWPFIILEVILVLVWYIHKKLRDFQKVYEIDLGKLNVFVYKSPSKKN